MRLATSCYSDDAAEHKAITTGSGSNARTRANIIEALRRPNPEKTALGAVLRLETTVAGARMLGGRSMFRNPGFSVMDEPEAALSFTSCLQLVALMYQLGQSGAPISPSPEPDTDADARFRNWMRLNLARAAALFGLPVTGAPVFGWRLRSIGGPALHHRRVRVDGSSHRRPTR